MTPEKAQQSLQRFKNGFVYNTQNPDGDTFCYRFDTDKGKMVCIVEYAFSDQKGFYEYTDEDFLDFLKLWNENTF